jgi:hypothetical protein
MQAKPKIKIDRYSGKDWKVIKSLPTPTIFRETVNKLFTKPIYKLPIL